MKRRHILSLSAALMASAAVSVPTAVPASGATTATTTSTLFAFEIFAPEVGAAPSPRCATNAADRVPAATADLPAGTVPNADIQGRLPNGVRGCRVMVSIGGAQTFAVYKSAQTDIRKRPLLRSGVRVVASRDEQTGVLVAEKIIGRQAARNEITRDFTATVTVDSIGDDWVTTEIGGTRQFTFDTTTAPADIEAGLGVGDEVAVQFDTVAPPPC